MAHPVLVNLSNDFTGQTSSETLVTTNQFTIGRGLNNGCIIERFEISRTHCLIERTANDDWSITDKSSNGTLLNGTMLDKTKTHKLSDGDVIALGEYVKFKFKLPDGSKQPLSEDEILAIADSLIMEFGDGSDEASEPTVFNLEVANDDNPSKSAPAPNLNNVSELSAQDVVDKSLPPPPPNNLECVENEFQCAICTEMLIQAVTLTCTHTFCKYCIAQWRKNQSICPICRTKITMELPTRMIDNFIEKVLETADEETKEHRRLVIAERQAVAVPVATTIAAATTTIAAATTTIAAATTSTSSASGSRRRPAQEPIEVSSDDNSDDDFGETEDDNEYEDENMSSFSGSDWERDYEDDDWFNYNGLPGVYYGGYGSCYSCGERGHWANGCPNRHRR